MHYSKIFWCGINFRQANCSSKVSMLRVQLRFQVPVWKRICKRLYENSLVFEKRCCKEICFQNWKQNQRYATPGPFSTDRTGSNLFLALFLLSGATEMCSQHIPFRIRRNIFKATWKQHLRTNEETHLDCTLLAYWPLYPTWVISKRYPSREKA